VRHWLGGRIPEMLLVISNEGFRDVNLTRYLCNMIEDLFFLQVLN
jgi:hypothetical protein